MLTQYKIGDLVWAKLGTAPLVGVVVYKDVKHERYLIRFWGTTGLLFGGCVDTLSARREERLVSR